MPLTLTAAYRRLLGPTIQIVTPQPNRGPYHILSTHIRHHISRQYSTIAGTMTDAQTVTSEQDSLSATTSAQALESQERPLLSLHNVSVTFPRFGGEVQENVIDFLDDYEDAADMKAMSGAG